MKPGDKVLWLDMTPAVVVRVGDVLILIEVEISGRLVRCWVTPSNLRKAEA